MRSAWLACLLLAAVALAPAAEPCAQCHQTIAARQQASPHALALRPYAGSRLESLFREFRLGERDGFQFSYGAAAVTARRGDESATGTLEWTFGTGTYAMTAVGRLDGQFYEHRMSYYTQPAKPGLTPGHAPGASASASAALGMTETPDRAFRCFNCHSTGLQRTADGGPDLTTLRAGIHCERCHGPGESHVAAARDKGDPVRLRNSVLNSGRLPARASVEVCGACHRAPRPGQSSDVPELDDPLSVRFQPVGLMASRCFQKSGSLSCLTCHDPHDNTVRRDAGFYAQKCLACHQSPAPAPTHCRRNTRQDCLPCHMPKSTPAPFLTFTDHRIRAGDP